MISVDGHLVNALFALRGISSFLGCNRITSCQNVGDPCEQRNNTAFDMRSGNTTKENKCFHCF